MKTMRFFFTILVLFTLILSTAAQQVDSWLFIGPLPVSKPGFVKGPDIKGDDFKDKYILSNEYLNLDDFRPQIDDPLLWDDYRPRTWAVNEVLDDGFLLLKPEKPDYQIAYSAFYIESDGLYTYSCEVESPQMFEIFLNGKKVGSNYKIAKEDTISKKTASLNLDRGKFLVMVKSMYIKGDPNKWKIRASVSCPADSMAVIDVSPVTGMNIHHLLEGTKLGSVSISPDGRLIIVNYSRVNTQTGKTSRWTEVKEVATGRIIQSFREANTTVNGWTPSGQKLYYTLKTENGSTVMVYDFEQGAQYAVLENIEDLGRVTWSDDEKFIFYGRSEKKPEGKKSSLLYMDELYNRTFPRKSLTALYSFNVNTGVSTRLSFGERSASLHDVSPDGNFIVFSTSRPNPTQRPFSLQNMYIMDVSTGKIDTLWKDFRWGGSPQFSPDGNQLLVSGGPDLFGETGRNIGNQPIANNYDGQLYVYTLETGEVDPITQDFNPAISWSTWNPVNNKIYVQAADEIYSRLFVWDPENRTFNLVITIPDVMSRPSMATESLTAAYTGTGLGDPNKAWILDLESGENRLFDNTEEETYKNVSFAETEEWDFIASDGTTIRGYFLYPLNFDPEKKYPLIVNYYGGTNPIKKSFGGRYPVDIWAGEDYVVYVPQPSGATGFGQEFSARHQNDWGKTTTGEIIEGTKKFIEAHDFVDSSKIGCIGASYGGFMTMLLQSQTDIFTCAISHAGISSISSYWGEGYWGFGYSANATGDSYPWNRKDIYIDQSALFNADKINTPLLLLHGSKDTNVPLGESLQLWVGLKILGKPVEMVQVEGEDHHILTYSKRIEWHNAIMAWFDKWLNGEDHDWKKLFPDSKL
ncbi:prolyl oligopeptidase family serine peptidase [Bacteroidota bacterium]